MNSMQFESNEAERLFRASFHLQRITQDRIFAVVQVRAVLRRSWPQPFGVYDPRVAYYYSVACWEGQRGRNWLLRLPPLSLGTPATRGCTGGTGGGSGRTAAVHPPYCGSTCQGSLHHPTTTFAHL